MAVPPPAVGLSVQWQTVDKPEGLTKVKDVSLEKRCEETTSQLHSCLDGVTSRRKKMFSSGEVDVGGGTTSSGLWVRVSRLRHSLLLSSLASQQLA